MRLPVKLPSRRPRNCRDHPAGLRAGEGIAGRARRARGTHGASVRGFFRVAMVGAFWAYDGWNACTFAGGEVKRPERNVPLALIVGTVAGPTGSSGVPTYLSFSCWAQRGSW